MSDDRTLDEAEQRTAENYFIWFQGTVTGVGRGSDGVWSWGASHAYNSRFHAVRALVHRGYRELMTGFRNVPRHCVANGAHMVAQYQGPDGTYAYLFRAVPADGPYPYSDEVLNSQPWNADGMAMKLNRFFGLCGMDDN